MRLALALAGLTLVAGCTTFDEADKKTEAPPPAYSPVEFAMPADTSVDRGDTVVVGDNQNWYGTLALTSDTSMDQVHEFYSSELPREGWEPLASLVSNRVVLQFINHHQGRACIVTIDPRTAVGGSHIEVIVSPLTVVHSYESRAVEPRSYMEPRTSQGPSSLTTHSVESTSLPPPNR
jgi:hypothetical protein